VCPHTVFIRSSVLRRKPTNLLPPGFEAQTNKSPRWFWGPNHQTIDLGFKAQIKKPSQWFWGQTTDKPSPPVLRLNQKTLVSCLLHVYNADRTRRHPTSQSSGHWEPDLCLIIPDPLHQVSYSSSLPTMSHSSPTHHETSKHISPHWITESGLVQPNCIESTFKIKQVNYSSHK
jgi:hypothetical protein